MKVVARFVHIVLASLLCVSMVTAAVVTRAPAAGAVEVREVVVDAAGGSDGQPGTAALPVRTIGAGTAIAEVNNRAGVATRVVVRAGTYREAVKLNRWRSSTDAPITLEAQGEVVVSGSDVWTGWTPTGQAGVVARAWPHRWGVTPLPDGWADWWAANHIDAVVQRREMVFVNGQLLRQVLSADALAATAGSFFVDEAAGQVYLRPPAGTQMATATVEVAAAVRTGRCRIRYASWSAIV